MKRSLYMFFLILLLGSKFTYAGQSVCHSAGVITGYRPTGSAVQGCLYFDGALNGQNEYDRVKTLFETVPLQHIKIISSSPVEMNSGEKTAVNDAMAAAETASIRTNAKNQIENFQPIPLYQRAFADIVKDEINILRKRDRDRAIDVAAATSLADLKTRWAARSSLDDRTLGQLKTQIQQRIDSGQIDS